MTVGYITRPAVVATDLDGTLLRSDRSISVRTRDVLRAVEDIGVQVVFVTARPPRWLPELADVVARHGHVICLGGACVIEFPSQQLLVSKGFDDATVLGLIADLRAGIPGVALAAERTSGPVYDPGFSHEHDRLPVTWITAVERSFGADAGDPPLPAGPVAKLLARCPGLEPDELHAAVSAIVGDRAHLAYSGAVGLAELFPQGVTKAAALAEWCRAIGVGPDQVWAFGDMPNDLPMLTWAGRSFAVANAHADVRAAVTDHTSSNDDDGVAQALEVLLSGDRAQ